MTTIPADKTARRKSVYEQWMSKTLHPYGRVVEGDGGNCVRIESWAALEPWTTKGREMERRRSEEPGLYRPQTKFELS
ncbi:hypothetical protein N7465_010223 [Penicillium sp. CMV-2018d]|nr:hypothetical protein N7465_010223 [Penicillium sp. CMV-2018d]